MQEEMIKKQKIMKVTRFANIVTPLVVLNEIWQNILFNFFFAFETLSIYGLIINKINIVT